MNRQTLFSTSLLFLFLGQVQAEPALSDLGRVDSVLERLEKKLMDKGLDSIDAPLPERSSPLPTKKIDTSNPTQIVGSHEGSVDIAEFESILNGLENSLDEITTRMEVVAYNANLNSKNSQETKIRISLPRSDLISLNSGSIKLNGIEIFANDFYRLANNNSKDFTIFRGPLAGGEHQLEVELTIKNRKNRSSKIHTLKNSFTKVVTPNGKSLSWILTIRENKQATLHIKLEENSSKSELTTVSNVPK